jgi:hypothetical protein
LPDSLQKRTESPIIARFSSRETFVTTSRWSPHVFPTRVTTGAKHPVSAARPGSSAASRSRRRVIPNAAIVACSSGTVARSSKSSRSFGFESGNPASIIWMPRRSSASTTRTFSGAESDMP